MKTVSIFGCGWLGKALATYIEEEYVVKGSVRSQSSYDDLMIKNRFLLNEDNAYYADGFYDTDIVIIAVPPRGEYIATLEQILSYTRQETSIILCSSTSVYTQERGIVYEEDAKRVNDASVMLEAEGVVQKLKPFSLILRIGGLMGYDRIAGRYTAGKSLAHDSYVNYIHRDDVVRIIHQCIEKDIQGKIYNLVAPKHVSKREICEQNASQFGFEKTYFDSNVITGKKVSSLLLMRDVKYQFLYANPLDFWKQKR